jgi:putative phage-type endonuclease
MAKRIHLNGRPEWLRWRRTGVGASDSTVIAGVSPYDMTVTELFMDKTGRLPERTPNKSMKLGLALEPLIALAFTNRTGIEVVDEQMALQSEEYPWMLSTLDRRCSDKIPLELKFSGHYAAKKLSKDGDTDGLREDWVVQTHHQMCVDDAPASRLAALIPRSEFDVGDGMTSLLTAAGGMLVGDLAMASGSLVDALVALIDHYFELRVYDIPRNNSLIESIVDLTDDFWDHVKRDDPPTEVEGADAGFLARLYEAKGVKEVRLPDELVWVASEYERLSASSKEDEEAAKDLKAQILRAMEDATVGILPDGRTIKRSVVNRKGYQPKFVEPSTYATIKIQGVA